jgi:hypothetical protein
MFFQTGYVLKKQDVAIQSTAKNSPLDNLVVFDYFVQQS